MSSRTLDLILRLKDEASKELSQVENRLQTMQPTFKRMAVIGTAAFVGITAAVMKSVNAYAEVERAQRQLEHAVIGVSKGTRDQVVAIQEISKALEKKVGIDQDALNIGAAQLSTFGLQSESVVNLTKSLADFTVNQHGVNAASDQYVQSANTIAKALQGQFGILEKSGIRFTEAQQQMILYGTETEKVSALTAGFAQNLRETTDTIGGVDVMMAKFARSTESVGDSLAMALLPAVTSIMESITPLIQKFSEWAEKNPELVKQIVIGTLALAGLVAVIGTLGMIIIPLKAGILGLGAVFAFIASPIGIIIALIGTLVGLGWYLYNNWEKVAGGLKIVWENIAEVATAVWNGIKEVVRTVINFMIGMIEGWVNGWIKGINLIINSINRLSSIAKKVGISIPKIQTISELNLPRLAQGGIVTRPTTALIGEAGPEAVIPLKKMPMGITINVYGDVSGEELIRKVEDAFAYKLKQGMAI